jgi:hypothetical protein
MSYCPDTSKFPRGLPRRIVNRDLMACIDDVQLRAQQVMEFVNWRIRLCRRVGKLAFRCDSCSAIPRNGVWSHPLPPRPRAAASHHIQLFRIWQLSAAAVPESLGIDDRIHGMSQFLTATTPATPTGIRPPVCSRSWVGFIMKRHKRLLISLLSPSIVCVKSN